MKGNEAIAHAAIRCGCDGYFGYPITPQSEVIETLAELKPWETTGMQVVQAESELASIYMVYGAAGAGKRAMTSSSSPGIALMQEGITYMAGAEVPGVFVNVQRGGPAFKYRNPAMILSDGVIGQMMEKVVLPPFKPRRTDEEVIKQCPWASTGKPKNRDRVVITSLELKPEIMEQRNIALQEKYAKIQENEVRFEQQQMDDAEYAIVAFGSAARIAEKSVEIAREQGIKVGLFRPITLFPFPEKQIAELSKKVKGILVAEINAGQMVQDVRLAVNGAVPVEQFGRLGGIVPDPEEIVEALKDKIMK